MHRRVVLSFVILFGLAAVAQAVPTITVGAHPGLPQSASVSIDINVTGGDAITGEDLWISIADQHAGAGFGDPTPPGQPTIVNIDGLTGTIWAGNNTGQTNNTQSDQVWQVDTTSSSGSVTASGKLFTITINTLTAPQGSTWALRVLQVSIPAFSLGPFDSTYSNSSSVGNVFGGSNGSFTIVPEPASIVLGLFAAAGLGVVAYRRRRARA